MGSVRSRGRGRRVVVVVLVVMVLLTVGGVAAVRAYSRSLAGNVDRVDAFASIPASARPAPGVSGAMNVLLLGSDSRDPVTTASSRTDTIMLLHVDADHERATVISIPRDTWVFVPTSPDGRNGNTMAKINAAYAWGGAPLTVQTVETWTGVRIDHVVLIDFAGFQQVVDALGGVDVTVEETIASIFPPHRVFTQGVHHFTGTQALDYERQRYQFADGDFTRQRHQQEFLRDVLDEATSSGTLSDPVRLNAFLQAVTRSMTVDQGFDLVGAALQFRDLRGGDLTFLTSPSTGTAWVGDQSVVQSDTVRAKALYQAVGNDTMAQWLAANPTDSSPSTTPTR